MAQQAAVITIGRMIAIDLIRMQVTLEGILEPTIFTFSGTCLVPRLVL